jgi:hypothetical protein
MDFCGDTGKLPAFPSLDEEGFYGFPGISLMLMLLQQGVADPGRAAGQVGHIETGDSCEG